MRFVDSSRFFNKYKFSNQSIYSRQETSTYVFRGVEKTTGQNFIIKNSLLTWGLPDITALSALPGYQEYNIIPILEYTFFVKDKDIHIGIVQPCSDEISQVNFNLPMIQILLSDILPTLRFIHASGMAHCDIKPENILFYKGKYCLNDFGRARKCVLFSDQNFYTSGQNLGGMYGDYSGLGDYVSQKCDIYSLAKTCIRLFTQDATMLSNFPPQFKIEGKLDILFDSFIRRMMVPINERATVEELLLHPFLNLGFYPLYLQPKPKISIIHDEKKYDLLPIFRKLFSMAGELDYTMDTLMVAMINLRRIIPFFKISQPSEIVSLAKVILFVTAVSMNEYVKSEYYKFTHVENLIPTLTKILEITSGFLTPYTPFDFVSSIQEAKTVIYDILLNSFNINWKKNGFQIPYSVREFLEFFKNIITDIDYKGKIKNREDYFLGDQKSQNYRLDRQKLLSYLRKYPFDVRTVINNWHLIKDPTFGPQILEEVFGKKSIYYRSWDIILGIEKCNSLLNEKDWIKVAYEL